MRVITIFSEKGGMGKTTLSIMLASFLAYEKKQKVFACDFDFPGYQMLNTRENDLRLISRGIRDLVKLSEGNEFYPIRRVKGRYDGFSKDELERLVRNFATMRDSQDGYLILDFPGRFLKTDPAYVFLQKGFIDLVVFPIDTDRQSITSALNMTSIIRGNNQAPPLVSPEVKPTQEILFLWNKENRSERRGSRDWYGDWDRLFESLDIPVAGARIRDVLIARRDPDTFGFIRSTTCWPKANVAKQAPYLVSIFEEIQSRADGTWSEAEKQKIYGEQSENQ